MSNELIKYLKHSNEKRIDRHLGEISIGGLLLYIKEPLPERVDVEYCFQYIIQKMPSIFYNNLDKVFIGQFPFLKSRQVDAIYRDKCIYITNKQQTNETLISDIIHEIAHSFEEKKYKEIYDDNRIKIEFLSKREALFHILQNKNMLNEKITESYFYETEYNQDFDEFLYKTIGYDRLAPETRNIFLSPYAATSLREYFANAFEFFFVKDILLTKKYAPSVYEKLIIYLEF